MIQLIGYVLFTALILVIAKAYLDKKGHPKALFYLFFAEMWERFSFYGMRALLTLYLIKDFYQDLQNNEEIAYGIYAAYGALVYLTPLLGGYLADKYIGYRKSILFGGILMALGHFFMAFPTEFFFYGALGLLIMGNGFFKPNISTLVGSLYEEGDIKRDGGFTIFYMGINLGAMIAPLFCGYLGEVYGWHYGFGAAGLGMLAGLLVFWKGIQANVLGDKGLQPVEYINKKVSGISVTNLIYTLGFVLVPVFAYLIIKDTESNMLGNVLTYVGIVVLIYIFYLMYAYKSGDPENLNLKKLLSFEGRIRRSQYWQSLFIVIGLYFLILSTMDSISVITNDILSITLSALLLIISLATFWFSIAQTTKRCHDRNNSGWWQLIPFYTLWLMFADGDEKTNDYGINLKDNNTEHNKNADRLLAIMILAVFCTIFWACFEQAGSSITVWADKCVNLVGMNASQTNAINPAYIVLLAIPFSWMWTKLGDIKRNPNTPMKFALGIFQLGLGFLIFAATAHFIGENGKVPFLFMFLGYFLITTGELFLSPIGLSKVTELSPKKIAAFMMGVWFLSSTFAHYISGQIAKLTTSGRSTDSNWLSDLTDWFMGYPDTSNELVATIIQYNSIYGQIGFVTIFIAIFVVLISPYIKKLMHGIH